MATKKQGPAQPPLLSAENPSLTKGIYSQIDSGKLDPHTPALYFRHPHGDIWIGDALVWLRSLETASIDLVFADPPYNIKKAEWDTFESQQHYVEWSLSWMKEVARILKPTGSFYICGFSEILADLKLPASQFFRGCRWLVWHYKYLLARLLGREIPVVAIFLHDVQRASTAQSHKAAPGATGFGVASTFKKNHFLGYTVALNRLDGVYYVDPRPEMLTHEKRREQIHDFQHFIVSDLWSFSHKTEGDLGLLSLADADAAMMADDQHDEAETTPENNLEEASDL